MLLTAPIASVLGGIAFGHLWSWMIGSIFTQMPSFLGIFNLLLFEEEDNATTTVDATPAVNDENHVNISKSKKNKKDNKTNTKKTAIPTVTVSETAKVLKGDPML